MMMQADDPIEECLRRVQLQLDWGDSGGWKNYDFAKLSDIIQDKTGVLLSVTTLKRLFGRLKYEHLPSTTTLNTLAQFLGFIDWRQFSQQFNKKELITISHEHNSGQLDTNEAVNMGEPLELTRQVSNGVRAKKRYWAIGIGAAVVVGIVLSLSMGRKGGNTSSTTNPPTDSRRFLFKADKVVGDGVPNSVVFTYDASAAKTDSVYIVQTWDDSRKTLVSRSGTNHSAIYYYPGYFRTKLIVDGAVVKSHDLQITSGGWLCLMEQDPTPLYFRKEQFIKPGRVEVDTTAIKALNIPLHPKPPLLRFYNQGDLGDLMNDNFIFETTLKNDFRDGAAVCQRVEVLIQCKDDIIIIPLSTPACTGDLSLYAAGKDVSSKESDLTKFGCNLTEWTKLRVEATNSEMVFFVNDIKAYTLVFPNEPTGIVGVQYRFTGSGAVRDTKFVGAGKIYKL